GLLTNSFVRLVLDDRGFDPKDVLSLEYRVPLSEYVRNFGSYQGMPSMEVTPPTAAIERVHERLKALPGAESVAGSSARPVNGILPPTALVQVEEHQPERVFYFLVT